MLPLILTTMLISATPVDKVAHFGLSYAMTHSCQVIVKKVFDTSKLKSALVCAGATLAVGAAKELADPYMGGNRDAKDFAADALGVGFAVTIIAIDW